jgi:L-alanine-DL-glutamate epimerase-like enolase superfamily enzyme
MRISGVRTFPVQTPFPHRGGRHWLFVRVDTKEGLSGYGEVYLHSLAFQPPVVAFMVEDLVLNVLKGHDPYETEGLFQATSIPIAAGERLTTKYPFAELLRHQSAAVFNLDVGQVGGILEARKIAGMAEAHYVQVSPHVWAGPLIAAASIQLAMSCPNFLIMESIERFEGLHAELIYPPIEWRDGWVVPSALPGLGHDLVEAVAARYAVK